MDLFAPPATSPALLYRYRDGVYAVELLVAAITELDLFTGLDDEPLTLGEICARWGLVDRPADVMVTLFVAMGLLERKPDGRVGLTPLAREHLVSARPRFLGPYYGSLRDRPFAQSMLRVLRQGEPANWGDDEWIRRMGDEQFATEFTREMDCRGVTLGPELARALDRRYDSLLDIGGGSGVYACALAAAFPQLKATVLEKPPVDAVATRSIKDKGFAERVAVVAADMFEETWPRGHDFHLLSNVVHDWNEGHVRDLLARSFESLEPGGSLVIHDAHLDAAKTGPLAVAEYSVLLMHFTEGKCYSVAELEKLLAEEGFTGCRWIPTTAERSLVVAEKPRP